MYTPVKRQFCSEHTTKMTNSIRNGFEYVTPIPEDRYEDVLVHLRNNFFCDEPLNRSIELCKRGETHKEMEDHSLKTLKDNYSIIVYEPATRKIAGVVLNKVVKKDDYENDSEGIKSIPDSKYKTIFNFMYAANLTIDVFKKYNIDVLFEHRILSVDSEFRGRGIAIELVSLSESIARTNGFKVLKADATNLYSQKVMTKLKFEKVLELYYENYKNDDGEAIFKTPEQHDSFSIMVKYLGD